MKLNIDWAKIDWTKKTAEIAKELGCNGSTVLTNGKAINKVPKHIHPCRPRKPMPDGFKPIYFANGWPNKLATSRLYGVKKTIGYRWVDEYHRQIQWKQPNT